MFMCILGRKADIMEEIKIQSWYIKILCHPMELQEFFCLQDSNPPEEDINGHSRY